MFLISKPQINTDIYLSHYGVFNITCMYKVVSKPLESCDQYVTQPIETNHILRPYIGTFLPKEMNLSGANGQGANLVYLSIDVGNNYTFRNDIDVVDRPTRALKRMMLMQVLDSEVSTVTNNQSIITVAITPQNFIVQEEVEQRNSTLISIIANFFAYYTAIVAFYAFLFGVDLISPWGSVHNGCCGFKKLKMRTEESLLPLVNDDTGKHEDNLELPQKVEHLKKFEFFLKDYIVDTSLLESIKQQSSQRQEQQEQEEPLQYHNNTSMTSQNG
ncbi:6257_t:CDS:2 [Entrophospora sp. SA101]|nr:6257_t:CDS:2 [Entrophospora sp. SA101]